MKRNFSLFFTYFILIVWSFIILFPIWTMIVNSLKPQKEIFQDPFGLPSHFTTAGYEAVWNTGRFDLYFFNTIYVTVISLTLILLLGSMAAYALAQWKSPVAKFLYIF